MTFHNFLTFCSEGLFKQFNDLLSQLEPYWLLEAQQLSIVQNDEAAFIQLRHRAKKDQILHPIWWEAATLTGQT